MTMIIKNILASVYLTIFTLALVSCGGDDETNSVSIQFIEADPTTITLKGTGGAGLSETSNVQFRVKDPDGISLEGQIVNFSLSTSVGGITLSPQSAVSDVNGLVNTVIQSGSIPTPVRIIGTIPGTDVSTQSDQLAIGSGIPDQDSMTVVSEKNNPEGFGIVGTEVIVTARLGDVFNNPVPAGTSVSFTTEGGSIDDNCVTDDTGACSVTWRSQNPRPGDPKGNTDVGDGVGILTILATALGQESFTDRNGNGVFDAGDSFDDIGEAFRDDNNNNVCDAGEFFEDINDNGLCDGPDGLYNGSACEPGNGFCSDQKNIHVRSSTRMVMSTSFGKIVFTPSGTINATAGPVTVNVHIEDNNGNSMPGSSSISVSASNGEIQNTDAIPTSVPDNLIIPYNFEVNIGSDGTSSNDGVLTVTVTTPNQNTTTLSVGIAD